MNLTMLMHRLSNVRARKKDDSLEKRMLHLFEEVQECSDYVRDGKDLRKIVFVDEDGIQKPEGFGIELADVVIEALRIMEDCGIDPDHVVELKTAYHEARRVTKAARRKAKKGAKAK